jgi:hypothetical protein
VHFKILENQLLLLLSTFEVRPHLPYPPADHCRPEVLVWWSWLSLHHQTSRGVLCHRLTTKSNTRGPPILCGTSLWGGEGSCCHFLPSDLLEYVGGHFQNLTRASSAAELWHSALTVPYHMEVRLDFRGQCNIIIINNVLRPFSNLSVYSWVRRFPIFACL